MFLSVFGFLKKTPRDHREVAPERIYLTKSKDSRKNSKTIGEFTKKINTPTDENKEHNQTSNMSLKDLYNANSFDKHNTVPTDIEFQVPFGHLVPDKSTNADTNILENHSSVLQKQFVKIRQELKEHRDVITRVARELQEMRDEMKNHRKWY